MSEYAVEVQGVSKEYKIGRQQAIGSGDFRQVLVDAITSPFKRARSLLGGESYGALGETETIWALSDINFNVKHGEVVGIIGKNGAGKSTLLKILSRITKPTTGSIRLHGRVGSLLEVGTGFHMDLTGRENIYLNGAILGMPRQEIDRKFDEIVDFSGVEKFIDTPVKFYSSGMGLRLGFAVAAHLEPEILIVDEVLAVGDAEFQKKCIGKMSDVAGEGRTVLFVSHNMAAVRNLCTRAIMLEQGALSNSGEVDDVIDSYLSNDAYEHRATIILPEQDDSPINNIHIQITNQNDKPSNTFRIGEVWKASIEFEASEDIEACRVAFGMASLENIPIATYFSKTIDIQAGLYRVDYLVDIPLLQTTLEVIVGFSSNDRAIYYQEDVAVVYISSISVNDQPVRSKGVGIIFTESQANIQAMKQVEEV